MSPWQPLKNVFPYKGKECKAGRKEEGQEEAVTVTVLHAAGVTGPAWSSCLTAFSQHCSLIFPPFLPICKVTWLVTYLIYLKYLSWLSLRCLHVHLVIVVIESSSSTWASKVLSVKIYSCWDAILLKPHMYLFVHAHSNQPLPDFFSPPPFPSCLSERPRLRRWTVSSHLEIASC